MAKSERVRERERERQIQKVSSKLKVNIERIQVIHMCTNTCIVRLTASKYKLNFSFSNMNHMNVVVL